MANIDWIAIKNEYINTGTSYRKLAERHNVSFSTLQTRAKKESWKNERDKQYDKTMTKVRQKTADVIIKKEVDRAQKLLEINDGLMMAAQKAIEQLSSILVDGETVDIGLIDTLKMKQIASVAKDLKDIQTALQAVTDKTKDNGLNTAIEKSAEGVWIDEIREDKPQADEGLDMVGGAEDCE